MDRFDPKMDPSLPHLGKDRPVEIYPISRGGQIEKGPRTMAPRQPDGSVRPDREAKHPGRPWRNA